MYETNEYEGMLAETISMTGANGDTINAYYARPLGKGPFPGVVAIHHLPGWDAAKGHRVSHFNLCFIAGGHARPDRQPIRPEDVASLAIRILHK